MKMFLSIKFNRTFIKGSDVFPVPGSYDMKTSSGENFTFDFLDTEGIIDTDDNTIIHYSLKTPDYESFPDSIGFKDKINDIKEIVDMFVYCGEEDETAPYPCEIIGLGFEVVGENNVDESNECFTVNHLSDDITTYEAKEKLFSKYKFGVK